MIYIPQNILAQEWTFLLAYFSSFMSLIHGFFKISFGFVLALTFKKKTHAYFSSTRWHFNFMFISLFQILLATVI